MKEVQLVKILVSLLIVGLFCFGGNVLAAIRLSPRLDLIRGSGPEVYVLEQGTKHWVKSIDIFNYFNFNWNNIKSVSDAVLETYADGDDFDKYDRYPDGALLRGPGPEVYLMELGQLRWIPSPQVMTANNYGWRYIIDVSAQVLNKYQNGLNLSSYESARHPETTILSGPDSSKTLESLRASFKYTGTNPLGENNELTFETYLRGEDTNWRSQGSRYELTYSLDDASRKYTFFVRAKNKQGYYDPTPARWTFEVGVSDNYGQVQINSVRPNQADYTDDYIVLLSNESESIDITGWKIVTKSGSFTIPQAAKTLKSNFQSSTNENVILARNHEAIIVMGNSPVGVNFRTNKCTGYLNENYNFYPALDRECPLPADSDFDYLNDDCVSFVDRVSRCAIPDYSDNYAVSSDSQCTDYLTSTFGYSQCYLDYSRDVDFYDTDWYIFAKKTSTDFLDNDDDTIFLRDSQGRLVDEYEY